MPALTWAEREPALQPGGLVARRSAAAALLAQLAQRPPAQLADLTLAATRDLVVLLGPAEVLPWVDGARYCAPDPLGQQLWLPTNLHPGLATDLMQVNLMRRLRRGPFLLWDAPLQLVPLDGARPVDHAMLAWLAAELD